MYYAVLTSHVKTNLPPLDRIVEFLSEQEADHFCGQRNRIFELDEDAGDFGLEWVYLPSEEAHDSYPELYDEFQAIKGK